MAPSPLNLFTTWMVLLRKRFKGDSSLLILFLCRYNEIRAERKKAKMRFRRAMREEIMAKAPGMRLVSKNVNIKNGSSGLWSRKMQRRRRSRRSHE